MGTIDWSDVNGMVDEAIKRGLADKDKVRHVVFTLSCWLLTQTIVSNWRLESGRVHDGLGH